MKRQGFATKHGAKAELTKLLAEHLNGTFIEPDRITFAPYMTDVWMPA